MQPPWGFAYLAVAPPANQPATANPGAGTGPAEATAAPNQEGFPEEAQGVESSARVTAFRAIT